MLESPGASGSVFPAQVLPARVLIVDDDEDVRTLLGLILDLHSIPHDDAENGAVALERIETQEYDAIILDLMMPVLDGFGVMRSLGQSNPTLLRRVVVLTAATREVQSQVDHRVFGILTKPFAPSELTDCIQRCRAAAGNESRADRDPRLRAPGIELDLCEIPSGLLLLGSETGRNDEKPVREVVVASFGLGRTQVTNAQYDRFVEVAAHEPAAFREQAEFASPDQPVVGVSWFDAAAFCSWLAQETGSGTRLPSEVEWEWAARGGLIGASHPWGDQSPLERYPDYASLWNFGPEPVGRHLSNGYGLHEMCENVHEWCADWYDPGTFSRRASRGGSWRHQLKVSTCSARSSISPDLRYADYGFRVAEGFA